MSTTDPETSPEPEREVFDYECQACEAQFNDGDEGGPLYECSRCGTTFTQEESADGESNRCPNCNIFAAKVADLTCPECQSDEVEHGQFLAPPPPTAEELAVEAEKRARSQAHTRELMDRHRAERAAQAAAWEALGDWYEGIDGPEGTLSWATSAFKDGSQGCDLRVTDADRIAALILGETVAPLPPTISDEYDAARAEQVARWASADGFPRAFTGIEHYDEDLSATTAESFGGRFPSMGIGITEPEYRAIAQRVIAAKRRKGQAA